MKSHGRGDGHPGEERVPAPPEHTTVPGDAVDPTHVAVSAGEGARVRDSTDPAAEANAHPANVIAPMTDTANIARVRSIVPLSYAKHL